MIPTWTRLGAVALSCALLCSPAAPARAQSTWGDARLVEDLRIGVLDGDTNYTFGALIQGLTVGPNGSIYVIDRATSAGPTTHVREFTPAGRFARLVGRFGQGPGEFNDPLGLSAASNGDLLMFDTGNNRVAVYDSAGKSKNVWTIPTQLRSTTGRLLVADGSGGAYVPGALSPKPPANQAQAVVYHFTAAGALDTIPMPECSHAPALTGPFQPGCIRALHTSGGFVIGWSETYAFDLRVPGKPVVHFQRSIPIERLQPEEEAEQSARVRSARPQITRVSVDTTGGRPRIDTSFASPPVLSTVKPAFKSFLIGLDGRIWTQVSVRAEKVDPPPAPARAGAPAPLLWVEPIVYDVFEPDGRYVGRVRMPANAQFRTARGDYAYGIVRGDYDEAYVVRWHIMPGAR